MPMVGSRGVQKNTYKYTAMAAQEAMAAGSRSFCRPLGWNTRWPKSSSTQYPARMPAAIQTFLSGV